MANWFKDIRNYSFQVSQNGLTLKKNTPEVKKDLSNYPAAIQLERVRQDVKMWRDAIKEAEAILFPYRVKLNQMYLDTVLEGHVRACMRRRRRLTVLREFTICNEQDVENADALKIFQAKWFHKFMKYVVDAEAYGYSLIALGDLIKDDFPNLKIVKRWNVSPERTCVAPYMYAPGGVNFLEEPYADWHIWVSTDSENGISDCGYGYLYEVSLYAIFLRNLLGFNGDFVEMFSQPYRVGKTMKTEGAERDALEAALRNMGSAGFAIVDPNDEIAFLETKLGGTGWQGYDNLEQRCHKIVSKIILGHADALDSVPGKLGSEQGGDESPVSQALSEVQSEDGKLVENIVNDQLIPKLKNLGFSIPDGLIFKFKNDDEVEEFRRREDASNLETSNIAYLMAQAKLQMSPEYFTERTGIPCEVVEPPAPVVPGVNPKDNKTDKAKAIQNKLNKLYSKKVKK